MGNQLHSQTLWDATMAYWISRHLAQEPDALVLHMVGSFHVARGTGTPEHLAAYRPDASNMIVMLRPVDDIDEFEAAPDGEWGDFVIQTDQARTLERIECTAYLAELYARPPLVESHLHLGSAATGQILDPPRDALTASDGLAALDAAGIERALVLSLAYQFGGLDPVLLDEADLVRAENDFIAEQIESGEGRLTGACSVHPLRDYALVEIARCIDDLGLSVLKLHFTNSDVDLRSASDLDRLAQVFALLSDRGAGAIVHMRTQADDYGAEDARRFIEVLSRTPDVPIHIAHMTGWGGYDAATDAALGEFVSAIEDGRLGRDNIWFGLGAVVFQPEAAGADTALARTVSEANATLVGRIRELGTERVVYATDWPSWPPTPDPVTRIDRNVRLIRASLGLTAEELYEVFSNEGLLGAVP
jgi:predicted TIM-barrel fold metal-dependent hydrolase